MHSDKPLLATSITAMAKKKPLQGTGSRDFLFFLAYACKIADSRTLMGHFPTLNFESNGYGFESKWSPRRMWIWIRKYNECGSETVFKTLQKTGLMQELF